MLTKTHSCVILILFALINPRDALATEWKKAKAKAEAESKENNKQPDYTSHAIIGVGKFVGSAAFLAIGAEHEKIREAKRAERIVNNESKSAVSTRARNRDQWVEKIGQQSASNLTEAEQKIAIELTRTEYLAAQSRAASSASASNIREMAKIGNIAHAALDKDRTIGGALIQNIVADALVPDTSEDDAEKAAHLKEKYQTAVTAKIVSTEEKKALMDSLQKEFDASDKPLAAAETAANHKLDLAKQYTATIRKEYGPNIVTWPLKKISRLAGWLLTADVGFQMGSLLKDLSFGTNTHHYAPLGKIILNNVPIKPSHFGDFEEEADNIMNAIKKGR